MTLPTRACACWPFALLLGTWACSSGERLIGPHTWDTLFTRPGEQASAFAIAGDGTLFLATPEALYSASASTPSQWREISRDLPAMPVQLYAATRETVFARLAPAGDIAWWSAAAGWRVLQRRVGSRPFTWSIWGRSSSEVFAVGNEGLILRFDGEGWSSETNPLQPATATPGLSGGQADLSAVGGNDTVVYAASTILLRRDAGVWVTVSPDSVIPENCSAAALGVRARVIYTAGIGEVCLFARVDQRWQRVRQVRMSSRGPLLAGGRHHSDAVLFWSPTGDVVGIDDAGTHWARVTGLRRVRGAALHEDYLYFAGTFDGGTVVGRVRW